ncbi:hypothetical protein MMC07_009109 [Pseudocyphellaria aurata]|nr:hypothetical protein [Pseudocyphellaria aurata]
MSFIPFLQSWRRYVTPAKPAQEKVSSYPSARTTDDDPVAEKLFCSGSSDRTIDDDPIPEEIYSSSPPDRTTDDDPCPEKPSYSARITDDDPFPEKPFSSSSSDTITSDVTFPEKPPFSDSSNRVTEDDPYYEESFLLDPSDRTLDDDPCPGNLIFSESHSISDEDLFVEQEPPREQSVSITDDDEAEPHEEWEVLEIVDCRKTRKLGLQYKATYVGNWDDWNSNPPWQPSTDFNNAEARIRDYYSKLDMDSSPQISRHKRKRANIKGLS